MKYILSITFLLLSSTLYANVGMNAKIGYGATTSQEETEGVFCYGFEMIYFSDLTLCGSVGFDAWYWSDREGGYSASLTNSSIILSIGAAFPKSRPIANVRCGAGLVTWWKASLSSGGVSVSDTETNTFRDFFGVFDVYAPISGNFDIVFQGKYAHQTLKIEEESGYSYGKDWNTFSGKVGLQVIL